MGTVKRGDSLTLPLVPGQHSVYLAVDWCRSPSLEVQIASGETVTLECWPNVDPWHPQRAFAQPDEWIALVPSKG
jgi:hypothetical protein